MTNNTNNEFPKNLLADLVRHYYHFSWLAKTRTGYGLAHFIKTDENGKQYYNDPHTKPDEPIKKGIETHGHGLRVVAGTQKDLDYMLNKDIIAEIAQPIDTKNVDSFRDNIRIYAGEDGAVFFNTSKNQLVSIGQIHTEKLKTSKKHYNEKSTFPVDYLPPTEQNPLIVTTSTGKSMLLKTSEAFGDSYGISETVLTPIGTGLICHFRNGQLYETYLLDKITGQYEDHEGFSKAIGTYRLYIDSNGNTKRDNKGNILQVYETIADHNLIDVNTNKSVYDSIPSQIKRTKDIDNNNFLQGNGRNTNTTKQRAIPESSLTTLLKYSCLNLG